MRILLVMLLALVQANTPAPDVADRDHRQRPAARVDLSARRQDWLLPRRPLRLVGPGVEPDVEGHEYFGQWFEQYDPTLHDAIQGPVEEFLTGEAGLGYAEAAPGGTFVRIGIGVLRKPTEASFQRFGRYEIVDPGSGRPGPARTASSSSTS